MMKKPGYHFLDMDAYPRRDHFQYFRTMTNPFVGVTVQVDVTELVDFCRQRKISFYLAFMHAACLAANQVPQLRQRIHGDGIIEYDHCDTSHTEAAADGTYCYCTLHHQLPFAVYLTEAEKAGSTCRTANGLEEDEDVDSLLFISTLPWLHYTQLVQPTTSGDESNPRITWGKYEQDWRGRLMMPVTLLCHHALADGIHLAVFYQQLDQQIAVMLHNSEG